MQVLLLEMLNGAELFNEVLDLGPVRQSDTFALDLEGALEEVSLMIGEVAEGLVLLVKKLEEALLFGEIFVEDIFGDLRDLSEGVESLFEILVISGGDLGELMEVVEAEDHFFLFELVKRYFGHAKIVF